MDYGVCVCVCVCVSVKKTDRGRVDHWKATADADVRLSAGDDCHIWSEFILEFAVLLAQSPYK